MPDNRKNRGLLANHNVIEIMYAKTMVKLYASDRLRFYNKLRSLLRNRFSLMDALERLYLIYSKDGKDATDSMAIAVSIWMKSIQNGDAFSVALREWVPSTEALMLTVGDIANLELALENTVRVVEGMNKMREIVLGAVLYPLFLLSMVVLLIWGVGVYMVPPMVSAVPDLVWTGLAKSLVDLSTFVNEHPWRLILPMPLLIIAIIYSFPRWKNTTRTYVESIPPWSIYRVFIGVGWLLSLSSMVKAGTPVSKAMRALRDDASPYLLYRIDKALHHISNGENLGDSLYKTRLQFPDTEIIGDLRVYAELDNFAEALEQLSNEWLVNAIKDIDKKAGVLNGVAILLIAIVIAWVVQGTFVMQDQMVSGMGLG